jgi:hypothetical protein
MLKNIITKFLIGRSVNQDDSCREEKKLWVLFCPKWNRNWLSYSHMSIQKPDKFKYKSKIIPKYPMKKEVKVS